MCPGKIAPFAKTEHTTKICIAFENKTKFSVDEVMTWCILRKKQQKWLDTAYFDHIAAFAE